MVKGPHRFNYFRPADRLEVRELFDRSVDPAEANNIAEEQPELSAALRAELDAFLAKPSTQWASPPEVEIDEMQQGQLRALGYVIEGWKAK